MDKVMKAEIDKIIKQVCLSQRPCNEVEGDFEIMTQEEATSSLTALIIKWLEGKKQSIILDSRTGKSVEFMEMGGRYETDEKAVARNQLLTELVEEMK